MKKTSIILPILSLLFLTSLNSCSSTPEKFSTYECPMQCENKTYDKAGTCPVCEMDLEGVKK